MEIIVHGGGKIEEKDDFIFLFFWSFSVAFFTVFRLNNSVLIILNIIIAF